MEKVIQNPWESSRQIESMSRWTYRILRGWKVQRKSIRRTMRTTTFTTMRGIISTIVEICRTWVTVRASCDRVRRSRLLKAIAKTLASPWRNRSQAAAHWESQGTVVARIMASNNTSRKTYQTSFPLFNWLMNKSTWCIMIQKADLLMTKNKFHR